jgi:hypothetical protein
MIIIYQNETADKVKTYVSLIGNIKKLTIGEYNPPMNNLITPLSNAFDGLDNSLALQIIEFKYFNCLTV